MNLLNTPINEDCFTVFPLIEDKSIDLIFCDLPYGSTNCSWDSVLNLESLWAQYNRIIKDDGVILLYGQTPFDKVLGASNLKMLRYEWIWQKSQATGHLNAKKMPMKAHENILIFYKNKPSKAKDFNRTYNYIKTTGHKPINSYTKYVKTQNNTEIYGKMKKEMSGGGETDRYPRSVLTFPSDKQKSCIHSTQKPLALTEYMIKTYSNKKDVVLDNCAGSFVVAEACNNLKRNWICIEKSTKIFNEAIKERKL